MIKDIIKNLVAQAIERSAEDIQVEKPKNGQADYAVNVFAMAKKENKNPQEIATSLAKKLSSTKSSEIERVEAAGGYVNFYLNSGYLQKELSRISKEEHYGLNDSLNRKTIMVEYTDPNPFKLFHIGHLMSNTIGEAISRLYQASGAHVLRVNYQGDVGLHIAMAVWGLKQGLVLDQAYAAGAKAYAEDEKAKEEITEINEKIYKKSDPEIIQLYENGRKESLEYFEKEYQRLGTKFDHYFFESEVAEEGLQIVKAHPDIFVPGDSGAIVFKGEDYGLHTRVFVNSKGLPTYEAKELALNKKKFEEFHPDLSVIVTANEINEYFKVLLKAMSLIVPEVADKTKHVGHGVMRLPSGKMSSRTGDVVTADSLIEQTKEKFKEKENREVPIDDATREAVAIGAIKYTILKQSPGKDIVFDFDTSLAVKGDSAPYVQYTHARLKAILAKAGEADEGDVSQLTEESELALLKHFLEFPDTVKESADLLAPQKVALYAFQLADLANNFYEKVHVLDDENSGRKSARLMLIQTTAQILTRAFDILGIKTPERI